ncbi:hypothetical protein [Alkalithermobacter paradoxus]|uniref:Uncharacterized protein n=1 Tax=Alkalithermobacter paradoxus TaxID=29349 RepID=A0A1V4IC82_9FIRM|nr:hypothetical protein CLOTH_05080 [[Clostridium] thermoalcaliphilum]
MKERKFLKGEYEDAVDHAKQMLDKGIGMAEILETTNLTEKDVVKIQNKIKAEFNDE